MVNPVRGEIEAVLDGRPMRLCLTLGALAELEAALAAPDLAALAARLASGRISAGDLVRVIGAGLRGGGNAVGDAEVARMAIDGGAGRAVEIAAELLAAAFPPRRGPPGPPPGPRPEA